MDVDDFSRIAKLDIDRLNRTPLQVEEFRRSHVMTFAVGRDVANSYGAQLALATAINLSKRSFKGRLLILLPEAVGSAPCVLPVALGAPLLQFLVQLSNGRLELAAQSLGDTLVFGDATEHGIRVTFDGWRAHVGPIEKIQRLQERCLFPPAAMAAAALAVGEVFAKLHNVSLGAGRRAITLSLWSPNQPNEDGPVVLEMPNELAVVGLGHLGQAYLWSMASIPLKNPSAMVFHLMDSDTVKRANLETSALVGEPDIGALKTRVAMTWLEKMKFRTRLIERRLDAKYRRSEDEPLIVLSGVDDNEVRRWINSSEYGLVFDAGLGSTANNFDALSVVEPRGVNDVSALWPVPASAEKAAAAAKAEERARNNPGYQDVHDCGMAEIAGVAVGVPYVGCVAAALVTAAIARAYMAGAPRYQRLKLRLGEAPNDVATLGQDQWSTSDLRERGMAIPIDASRMS